MNIHECDVMNFIVRNGYLSQRILAKGTNFSLGTVNSALRSLVNEKYLDDKYHLTSKGYGEINRSKPRNAIILAAGFGMRMVPINTEVPKGLLKIRGETLIERLISQLIEVNINDIVIVVGFLKEKYEYLIDKYGVKLVYNPNYAFKNNIHSLNMVADMISNTYIIPCDIFTEHNPFSKHELYSWYSILDSLDNESTVKMNRKRELVSVIENEQGNKMLGISYLNEEDATIFRQNLKEVSNIRNYDKSFWEEALFYKGRKLIIHAKVYDKNGTFEINTYEQLREIDENSEHLNSEIISVIAREMHVEPLEILDIKIQKKGMTNRSFRFKCNNKEYIMRVPGEGTDKLINRRNEYDVYLALKGKGISDNLVYISPDNGYKITEYWNNARVCDPSSTVDVDLCMNSLRNFHNTKLHVLHTFDIFERIEFYESLWDGKQSIFADYPETKRKIFSLKSIIETIPKDWKLTHIDAVPDNFLFIGDEIRLIDWEYASMQDPHVDIAMFAIYSMFDRERVDFLINSYFSGDCNEDIRTKIYCYIAVCGLLWSNWCEYKRFCGVEFGDYSLKQYRFAKDYYRIVHGIIGKTEIEDHKGMQVCNK